MITLTSVQMQNKTKKWRQCHYRHENVQSYAGKNGFITSLHINNVFKCWNEPRHTMKGNKCYANIIYKHVPHIDSLHKERWLHYMYRIIEINDIMYNIYSFRFKIIQLYHYCVGVVLLSHETTQTHSHCPSILVCQYSNKCLFLKAQPGSTVKH